MTAHTTIDLNALRKYRRRPGWAIYWRGNALKYLWKPMPSAVVNLRTQCSIKTAMCILRTVNISWMQRSPFQSPRSHYQSRPPAVQEFTNAKRRPQILKNAGQGAMDRPRTWSA